MPCGGFYDSGQPQLRERVKSQLAHDDVYAALGLKITLWHTGRGELWGPPMTYPEWFRTLLCDAAAFAGSSAIPCPFHEPAFVALCGDPA